MNYKLYPKLSFQNIYMQEPYFRSWSHFQESNNYLNHHEFKNYLNRIEKHLNDLKQKQKQLYLKNQQQQFTNYQKYLLNQLSQTKNIQKTCCNCCKCPCHLKQNKFNYQNFTNIRENSLQINQQDYQGRNKFPRRIYIKQNLQKKILQKLALKNKYENDLNRLNNDLILEQNSLENNEKTALYQESSLEPLNQQKFIQFLNYTQNQNDKPTINKQESLFKKSRRKKFEITELMNQLQQQQMLEEPNKLEPQIKLQNNSSSSIISQARLQKLVSSGKNARSASKFLKHLNKNLPKDQQINLFYQSLSQIWYNFQKIQQRKHYLKRQDMQRRLIEQLKPSCFNRYWQDPGFQKTQQVANLFIKKGYHYKFVKDIKKYPHTFQNQSYSQVTKLSSLSYSNQSIYIARSTLRQLENILIQQFGVVIKRLRYYEFNYIRIILLKAKEYFKQKVLSAFYWLVSQIFRLQLENKNISQLELLSLYEQIQLKLKQTIENKLRNNKINDISDQEDFHNTKNFNQL